MRQVALVLIALSLLSGCGGRSSENDLYKIPKHMGL